MDDTEMVTISRESWDIAVDALESTNKALRKLSTACWQLNEIAALIDTGYGGDDMVGEFVGYVLNDVMAARAALQS